MTAPVAELDDHRENRPHRSRWRTVVAVVLVVALAIGAGWVVWFSSVLTVREVRVVGAEGARAERILDAAAVPVGLPLARLDAEQIAAQVRGVDWVREVEVRRGWPREVVLAVEPRVAVGRLVSGASVDAAGVEFEEPGSASPTQPRIDAQGVGLQAAVAVLTSLPDGLARRVTALSASTRDDVELTLRSGVIVRWGSADQPELKAEVVDALLDRRPRMVDVSAPELPTTFDERGPRKQ